MKTLTIVPVIDPTLAEACLSSLVKPGSAFTRVRDNHQVLVVDNTKDSLNGTNIQGICVHHDIKIYRDPDNHNLGVARAWNIGARRVVEEELDYLIIMSQSMLFGPEKETTWIKQMETFEGYDVIESTGHSWHLIAFHRRIFETIGYFDERFFPGYFEAIDFHRRMQLAGFGNQGEGHWTNVWVNALSQTVGHHSDLVLAPPLLDYYREKWNGDKHEEKYSLPFGDKPLGYWEPATIPELAKLYKLKNWW